MALNDISVKRDPKKTKKVVKSVSEVQNNIPDLTINNKATFILALRDGLGLTTACAYSGNNIIDISEMIKKYPDFRKECENPMLSCRNIHLKMLHEAMENNNITDVDKIKYSLSLLPSLILWRDDWQNELSDPTSRLILNVFLKHRNPKETATALGMSYDTYVHRVIADNLAPLAASYVKEPMI